MHAKRLHMLLRPISDVLSCLRGCNESPGSAMRGVHTYASDFNESPELELWLLVQACITPRYLMRGSLRLWHITLGMCQMESPNHQYQAWARRYGYLPKRVHISICSTTCKKPQHDTYRPWSVFGHSAHIFTLRMQTRHEISCSQG